MKRVTMLLFLFLALAGTSGCGRQELTLVPRPASIAVLTLDEKQHQNLTLDDRESLQRVMNWLDRDIIRRLRDKGLETSLLKDMKSYASNMGPLFIIHVESFTPGFGDRLARGSACGGASSLELSYKLLDERGALLTEWLDGADSVKGGTYCARALNRRAVERITAAFNMR